MSSMKIKNPQTGEWDVVASIEDRGIRVNNAGLKSDNLHGALTEIVTHLTNQKNNLAWIYKNGTIGGGGGTGPGSGATGKIITSITDDPHYVSTTEIVIIQFMVQSKSATNFNINLKIGNQNQVSRTVRPNTWENWEIGRLAKGSYRIDITGTDVDQMPLDMVTFVITAGALELTSTFNDKTIFNVASDIKIPFTAYSYLTTPLNIESKINSSTQPTMVDVEKEKLLEYPIGKRPVGVYNVELQATSGGFNSNKLEYTINVASTDQLFLSVASNINKKFSRGIPIKFAYTIAVLGYTVFVTSYKINGITGEMPSRLGTNVFEIPSDDLGAGSYTLELTCRDADNVIHTAEPLLIPIEITASSFEPYQPNQSGLIAWFQARGVSFAVTDQWKNLVPNSNITCKLTGINGISNGFISRSANKDAIDKALVLSGEAYATINYKPFGKDKVALTNGFSMSIIYRTTNVGDKSARVMDFGEYNPNTHSLIAGAYIDTEDAEFSTLRKSLNAKTAIDEWIHQTFVIDDTFMYVYNQGIMTSVVKHDGFGLDDTSLGVGDEKASNINLGMRQYQALVGGVDTLVRSNFADCEIKDIKLYQRALTKEQVVYNFVGDEYYLHTINTGGGNLEFDEQKQKDLRALNSMNDQGQFVIDTSATSPFALVHIKFENESERILFKEYSARTVWAANDKPFREFRCIINYSDHKNKRYLNNHNGVITLQGTSSIGYTSKNYEIYLGQNPDGTDYIFAPKTGWLPENQYTLKCNMMDSSHANNVGTGRIINNGKNDQFMGGNTGWFRETSPPQGDSVNNENYNKVRNALDGFPILLEIEMGNKDSNGNDFNYMGVYTFNMGRGSHYNMGLKNVKYTEVGGIVTEYTENYTGFYSPNTCFCFEITTSHNQGAGAFKQQSNEWIDKDFKRIYPENDSTEGINQLRNVVVSTSKCGPGVPVRDPVTGEEVVPPKLTESWSTQFTELTIWNNASLADYLILSYTLGMVDNLGKNFMMKTWYKNDAGQSVWYASFYDMDTILGLDNSGLIAHAPDIDLDRFPTGDFTVDQLPANNNIGRGQYNLSDSRLWGLYRQYYSGFETSTEEEPVSFRLRQRYYNLRYNGILTYENLVSKFMSVINEIGANYYNKDAEIKYMNMYKNESGDEGYHNLTYLHGTREHFTKLWLRRRIAYLDSLFDTSSNAISGNTASRDLKFRFNPNPTGTGVTNRRMRVVSRSPVFITVLWSGEDNRRDFSKLLCRADRESIFEKTFDAGTQSTNMNFGPEVMYMNDVGIGNPSYLDLKNASSLIRLDLSGNTFLQAINLEFCTSLRDLDLRNCTRLGEGASGVDDRKFIDVSACINLQNLDISNTKLTQVSLPTGGTLKTLRCNDTLIGRLSLDNQSFLEHVDLSNCTNLSEVSLKGCKQLKTLILPNTAIINFVASDCPKLEEVDLSNSKYLRSTSFNLTPNMKKLNVSYCNNVALTTIDMVGCPILEELRATSCVASLYRFPETINTLKVLVLTQSGVTRTKFGTKPDDQIGGIPAVNLGQFKNLTTVMFNGCASLRRVINCDLTLTNPNSMFSGCGSLEQVHGSMKISGSMTSMFANCTKLMLLGDTSSNTVMPPDTGNFPLNLDLTGVTSMSSTFASCTSLSLIDAYYVLRRTPNITSASSTFQGCTKIIATTAKPIDIKIFEKLTKLVDATHMFNLCSGLGGPIPSGLFNNMIALTTAYRMFNGCKFTTFPAETLINLSRLSNASEMFNANAFTNTVTGEYLFIKNTQLKNIESMFRGNGGFTVNINNDKLFAFNPLLENINSVFEGCNVNGVIDPNIFGGVTPTKTEQDANGQVVTYRWPVNLTSISRAFFNNPLTGTISDSLFANLTKLQYAASVFSGSKSKIIGTIPENLFANNPDLLSVEGFFSSLAIEGNIPSGLFRNNNKLSNVSSLFSGCTSLTSQIPESLFQGCRDLAFVESLFANCNKLSGRIPKDLFKITVIFNGVPMIQQLNIKSAALMFYSCYGLTGMIPEEFFKYMSSLESLDRFTYNCGSVGTNVTDFGLNEPIPKGLFKGLRNLKNIDGMFYRCNKIPPTLIQPENPLDPVIRHMIPKDLFVDNGQLDSMTSAFEYMSGAGTATLPLGVFDPLRNLTNASRAFYNTFAGNNPIDRDMFKFNNKLSNISSMFSNESLRTNPSKSWTAALDPQLFKPYKVDVTGISGNPIADCTEAFAKCNGITGQAVKFWEFPVRVFQNCYDRCNSLQDWSTIPIGYRQAGEN